MPNWCWNNLTVTGKQKDVERFCRDARGRTHTYNRFHGEGAGEWPAFDDIRLMALISTPPELGEESDFSFHRLYPVPEKVRAIPYSRNVAEKIYEKLGVPSDEWETSGYEWENSNWGVKWGASEPELTHKEDQMLGYTFNTPWGPPIGFCDKVAKDYPELCFELEFEEEGMGFAGQVIYEGGEKTLEDSWEMEESDFIDDE